MTVETLFLFALAFYAGRHVLAQTWTDANRRLENWAEEITFNPAKKQAFEEKVRFYATLGVVANRFLRPFFRHSFKEVAMQHARNKKLEQRLLDQFRGYTSYALVRQHLQDNWKDLEKCVCCPNESDALGVVSAKAEEQTKLRIYGICKTCATDPQIHMAVEYKLEQLLGGPKPVPTL